MVNTDGASLRSSAVVDALDEWRQALGAPFVQTDSDALHQAGTATFKTSSSVVAILRPANREEVISTMVAVTGTPENIARQTLNLYLEPDRGVMPKAGEFNLKGLAEVIAFMEEGGIVKPPAPAPERFVDGQYLKAAGVD